MQDRHEEQRKAETQIRAELEKYHVLCVSVLICQIVLPERLMETLTNKVVATQQMSMFDARSWRTSWPEASKAASSNEGPPHRN